ncbi:hypothetical protein [Cupriavidus lacunae]|nr:hypothetical protein [Cupriavidus lacunae]
MDDEPSGFSCLLMVYSVRVPSGLDSVPNSTELCPSSCCPIGLSLSSLTSILIHDLAGLIPSSDTPLVLLPVSWPRPGVGSYVRTMWTCAPSRWV